MTTSEAADGGMPGGGRRLTVVAPTPVPAPAAGPGSGSDVAAVRVLYVAGSGRSGSTLLDGILGQLDGFFSAGELRYVWERGLVANRSCGCGQSFRTCPVWSAVLEEAFGGGDSLDGDRLARVQRQQTRLRRIPPIVAADRRLRRGGPDDDDYRGVLGRLYRAVQHSTGARVVVDSSKLPSYGHLVQGVRGVDLYVVQLVRDPRATAYSWQRRREVPDKAGDERLMRRLNPVQSAGLWTLWNAVAELLWRRRRGRYLRLRYEDFVRDPETAVRRILALVGEESAELPFTSPTTVTLGPTHSVAGNPSRFRTGVTELRADTEWMTGLRPRDEAIVTALTWPLLLRYGYPLRRPRPEPRRDQQ